MQEKKPWIELPTYKVYKDPTLHKNWIRIQNSGFLPLVVNDMVVEGTGGYPGAAPHQQPLHL